MSHWQKISINGFVGETSLIVRNGCKRKTPVVWLKNKKNICLLPINRKMVFCGRDEEN